MSHCVPVFNSNFLLVSDIILLLLSYFHNQKIGKCTSHECTTKARKSEDDNEHNIYCTQSQLDAHSHLEEHMHALAVCLDLVEETLSSLVSGDTIGTGSPAWHANHLCSSVTFLSLWSWTSLPPFPGRHAKLVSLIATGPCNPVIPC